MKSKLSRSSRKGFTLIELLVVIAIIAVLSIVVILTLNPAELLRQARDSNRISDLGVIKSGISLYLADVSSPTVSSTCSFSSATSGAPGDAKCNSRYLSTTGGTSTQNGVFKTDGTGWVPINFGAISSGAPFGNLPRDPTNCSTSCGATATSTSALYYTYKGSSTPLTFDLNAKMESAKYKDGGTADVESTDGGSQPDLYESGTAINGAM